MSVTKRDPSQPLPLKAGERLPMFSICQISPPTPTRPKSLDTCQFHRTDSFFQHVLGTEKTSDQGSSPKLTEDNVLHNVGTDNPITPFKPPYQKLYGKTHQQLASPAKRPSPSNTNRPLSFLSPYLNASNWLSAQFMSL